jgi:hypothetical protein
MLQRAYAVDMSMYCLDIAIIRQLLLASENSFGSRYSLVVSAVNLLAACDLNVPIKNNQLIYTKLITETILTRTTKDHLKAALTVDSKLFPVDTSQVAVEPPLTGILNNQLCYYC